MSRPKILLVSLIVTALGVWQILRWRGDHSHLALVATASGTFTLMSGIAAGLYGLGMKKR